MAASLQVPFVAVASPPQLLRASVASQAASAGVLQRLALPQRPHGVAVAASSASLHPAIAFAAGGAAGVLAAARRRRQRRSLSCKVLPDGTNEEGEDLTEPLGLKRDELKEVVLYGSQYSPPCNKICMMLKYYGVPFRVVEGKHPTSDYKKIPVIEINGRQVNDSHVIFKNLAEVLTGKPMSEKEIAWEKKVTYAYQPAMEVELFGDGNDLAKVAGLDGWKQFLAIVLGPVLSVVIGSVFRSRYDFEMPTAIYGKQFKAELGDQPFYHGAEPGPIDLSLYGTYHQLQEKGCSGTTTFLKESGLEQWHEQMAQAVAAKEAA